jgi:hypothetical protein
MWLRKLTTEEEVLLTTGLGLVRNCVARSGAAEKRAVELGVCNSLHSIVTCPAWPACLRDTAAGCLTALAEHWQNHMALGPPG